LVKRLNEMRRLAEEDLTGNLLEIREMQQFSVYLVEDAYSSDFRHDFVEFFTGKLLSDEVLSSPEHPWKDYLLDAERFIFNTTDAMLLTDMERNIDQNPKFVAAGLHDIYIDFDFDEDQFDFFFDDPTADRLAYITVYIEKRSDPIIKNPFYYLPFNGNLGLEEGAFKRDGYGLVFFNDPEPLWIVSDVAGGSNYRTDSPTGSSARKSIATVKVDDFDHANRIDRGMIMQVSQDQSQINFIPSVATPVLAQMIPESGRVEAFYHLNDTVGGMIDSAENYMNLWNGSGSTMRSAEGTCTDFAGTSLGYRVLDLDSSGSCAGSAPGSYGFLYDPANNGEELYLETVFYTPVDMTVHLRKSCDAPSRFYSPVLLTGTDSTSTPLPLSVQESDTRVSTMEEVIELIEDEYVCISADSDYFSFWWNPQKVLEDLDSVKQTVCSNSAKCNDWETDLVCNVAMTSS